MGKIVNKNNISKDTRDGTYSVEMFEFMSGDTPMYSYFDSFKTEKEAIAVAKKLNPNNAEKIRNKLMSNPHYFD